MRYIIQNEFKSLGYDIPHSYPKPSKVTSQPSYEPTMAVDDLGPQLCARYWSYSSSISSLAHVMCFEGLVQFVLYRLYLSFMGVQEHSLHQEEEASIHHLPLVRLLILKLLYSKQANLKFKSDRDICCCEDSFGSTCAILGFIILCALLLELE